MRSLALVCCAFIALSIAAHGSTYTVTPDGSGDFPTIQAAIASAIDGDTIELADGIFEGDGNRDIDFLGKAVTVRSQSGDAVTCVIDCGGSEIDQHRGFIFQTDEGPDSAIDGITIMHGWLDASTGTYGGGVFCDDSTSPTISRCTFYQNTAAYGGGMRGGLYSTITECSFIENTAVRGGAIGRAPQAVLTDCTFVGNSGTYGGAIYIRSSCSPTLTGCLFEGNTASHSGGALHIEQHCDPVLSFCTLTGNSAPIGGALDVSIESFPTFESCTFAENSCTYTGVISTYEYSLLTFENCLIAFSPVGSAVSCFDSAVTLSCCDIYGNAGGDWVDYVADQFGVNGNISEDPLFCGDENPDAPYTLHTDSPCAPVCNPACGLVGAWDTACGATPVEEASWGVIKALYW